jgi:hypothetical protein
MEQNDPVEHIAPRVTLLVYNPVIESEGGRTLSQVLGWNDPDALAHGYIDDVRRASHGIVRYEIVERIELDKYPVKRDGFCYTDVSYLGSWRARGGFHMPDGADYPSMLRDADFERKVTAGESDELWIFGAPYFGFFESCLGGRDAIWCNGDVVPGTAHIPRTFAVMGFSYERGVGEMLENLGHRAENIMEHVFRDIPEARAQAWLKTPGTSFLDRIFGREPVTGAQPVVDLAGNLWRQFTRYDKLHPGASACGNVHFAPSSTSDYDWGNRGQVLTNADDWLNYPNFTGEVKEQSCEAWGHGDIRAHHVWWFERFPHVGGRTPTRKLNNWWRYVVGLELDPA